MNPVTRNDCLVEGEPGLSAIPADEIVDGTPIAPLCFGDRRPTSTADLACSKSVSPRFVPARIDLPRFVFLLMDATSSRLSMRLHTSGGDRASYRLRDKPGLINRVTWRTAMLSIAVAAIGLVFFFCLLGYRNDA